MIRHRPRSAGPVLLALLLVTVPLVGCVDTGPSESQPTEDAPRPGGEGALDLKKILGDPANSGLESWPARVDATSTTHDLDGDGIQEVIVHSSDRMVYVFDPTTGRALTTLKTSYPPAWHTESVLNRVAADTLVPGHSPSIVVANHAAYVSSWKIDTDPQAEGSLVAEKRWELRMDRCRESPSMDGDPELVDLDGDDELEILVQTEEVGLYALEPNGTVRWHHCWAGGNSAPTSADVDGDGRSEAIFASDSGLLAVFDGKTGDPQWTFDVTDHGIHPGSVIEAPTVADLDGQPPLEILFTARSAKIDDPNRYDENRMAIFAVRQNPDTYQAELVWMRQPDWANPMSNTRLVVQDVDDDGKADVFGMDWNTIGHRPGDWERLGPAHVFRLDAQGEDVWVREMDTWWSNKNIALVDVDGDGNLEVLANAPTGGGDGLWWLSAEDGSAEGAIATSPWKVSRGPQVVDLTMDGSYELLVASTFDDPEVDRGGILLYDIATPG